MNSNDTIRTTYTKRMTADVWFRLQIRRDLEVLSIHSEREHGEKLIVATFTVEAHAASVEAKH